MRLAQAARELGISPSTLRRLDRRGVVRLARDLSGQRRVSDGELELLRRIIYPELARPPRRRGAVRDGRRGVGNGVALIDAAPERKGGTDAKDDR